jgi:hypothetical protein
VVEPGDGEVGVEVTLAPEDRDFVRLSGRVSVDGAAPLGTHLLLTSVDRRAAVAPALNALGELEDDRVVAAIYEPVIGALDTTLTRLPAVDLRSDLHLELELFRMTVEGEVVDAATGAALPAAELFVLADGVPPPRADEHTSVVAGSSGRFRVVALVSSRARLWIRHPGYQPAEVALGAGAWAGVEIRLLPAGP